MFGREIALCDWWNVFLIRESEASRISSKLIKTLENVCCNFESKDLDNNVVHFVSAIIFRWTTAIGISRAEKEPSTFEIHVSTYLSTFLDKTKQLCQSVSEPSQRCQSRTPRARQAWGKPLAKPLKCWCRRATRLENESEINRSLADNRTSSREDAEVRVILNTTTERNRWIFAHSGVCLPASQRERFSLSRPGSSAREG